MNVKPKKIIELRVESLVFSAYQGTNRNREIAIYMRSCAKNSVRIIGAVGRTGRGFPPLLT